MFMVCTHDGTPFPTMGDMAFIVVTYLRGLLRLLVPTVMGTPGPQDYANGQQSTFPTLFLLLNACIGGICGFYF